MAKKRQGKIIAEGEVTDVDGDEDFYTLKMELDDGTPIELNLGYGALGPDIAPSNQGWKPLDFPKRGDRIKVTVVVKENPEGRKNMAREDE